MKLYYTINTQLSTGPVITAQLNCRDRFEGCCFCCHSEHVTPRWLSEHRKHKMKETIKSTCTSL